MLDILLLATAATAVFTIYLGQFVWQSCKAYASILENTNEVVY
jgi:hypothetical protein